MKLLLILDGLADSSYRELKGKTPLEFAKTPAMNLLARNSLAGTMKILDNIAPESDEALLEILGYDSFKVHKGRGMLEAFGADVQVPENCVVLRCNFVEYKRKKITDIEPILSRKQIRKMAKRINEEVRLPCWFSFVPTIGHRAVLLLRIEGDNISNTHSGYRIISGKVTKAVPVKKQKKIRESAAFDRKSKKAAKFVNTFVSQCAILLKKENMAVITRGCSSRLPRLKKMQNWLMLEGMPVEKAIGKLSGMKIMQNPGNLKKLARVIEENIEKKNVYVQIKAPDAASHKGDVSAKVRAIQGVDRFVAELVRNVDLKKTRICITADHATECRKKAHSNLPVPFLITGRESNGVKEFSEKACKKGLCLSAENLFNLF